MEMEDVQSMDARNHRMLQQVEAATTTNLTHAQILAGLSPDQQAVATRRKLLCLQEAEAVHKADKARADDLAQQLAQAESAQHQGRSKPAPADASVQMQHLEQRLQVNASMSGQVSLCLADISREEQDVDLPVRQPAAQQLGAGITLHPHDRFAGEEDI